MGTKELQTEIKNLLDRLNWSQKRLARVIYTVTHEIDDEDEIRRFEEKVKKALVRPTTKPELLLGYLEVISQHCEFKSLDIVVPVYQKSGVLSERMEKGILSISKLATKLLCDESDL
ncbi:MAG: hypothetical protein R3Y10_03230 [Ferrimonas sp.]